MNVRLVVEQGAKRKVMNLKPPQAVVGRSHGTTVRIPSSQVSRQHCRLVIEKGLVTVEDLGSVNGTFLNGHKIQDSEVVRPGDTLEVGPVRFVVEYILTPEALEKLQEMDGGVDMLEALADGEAAELDELPMLHELQEEESLPVLEELHEAEESDPKPKKAAAPKASDDAPLPVDFDFDGGAWQMPEGGDLHDLLGEMGPGDDPPTELHNNKPRR